MGIIINQGKQKVETSEFEPIVEKNVFLVVTKVEMDKFLPDTIKVTFKVLQGPNRHRIVYDRVGYNSTSKTVWKYQALRAAANVPYSQDEPNQIDIEALLLNKPLVVDLDVREYTNSLGETKVAQTITYHKWDPSRLNATNVEEPSDDKAVNFDDTSSELSDTADEMLSETDEIEVGDIPFKSAVEESGVQQQEINHKEPAQSLDYDWDDV